MSIMADSNCLCVRYFFQENESPRQLATVLGDLGGATQKAFHVSRYTQCPEKRFIEIMVYGHFTRGCMWCDPKGRPLTKLGQTFLSGNTAREIGHPGNRTRGDMWCDPKGGPVTA